MQQDLSVAIGDPNARHLSSAEELFFLQDTDDRKTLAHLYHL
jgi:hypothetical protein